jgi:hypothetical protein
MLKHPITYEDFNGETVTEEFYFNITKAEAAEMELSTKGGLSQYLADIVEKGDAAKTVAAFKEILLKSVGRRSPDGRRFVKNAEIIEDFLSSNAYSVLFMQLVTDAQFSADFINKVFPQDLVEKTQSKNIVDLPTAKLQAVPTLSPEKLAELSNPAPRPKSIEDYTRVELAELSDDEFNRLKEQQARNRLVRGSDDLLS